MTRPLCASIVPFADESLISMIARAAVLNEVPAPSRLLQFADVETRTPAFAAFTQHDASLRIASLLDVDPRIVKQRMHKRIEGHVSPTIDWFGTPLERRFIEVSRRRFSSSSIQEAAYGRLSWMIRPIHYCSESMETLRDKCPWCGKTLGWVRTRGLDRCEKCGKSLDFASTPIDASHADEAVKITNLLHHSGDIRNAELAKLPPPFNNWEAGEVFSAVVDLGLVAANPLTPYNHPLGKQAARGDFQALGSDGIFLGWRVMRGWPNSLAVLTETIMSANFGKTLGSGPLMGPLARHLHPRAKPTKFRALLRETLPEIFSRVNTSRPIASQLEKYAALNADAMTTSEAREALGISWKTMRRLEHKGKRLATHVQSPSCVRLYDAELISRMKDLRETTMDVAQVAIHVGVPPHVIPFFKEVGVLRGVDSDEISLLYKRRELISRETVYSLCERVSSVARFDVAGSISLRETLQHQLNPIVWAGAIEAILSGQIVACLDQESKPLFDVIRVDSISVASRIADWNVLPNTDVGVSIKTASPLMRMSKVVLSRAASSGLIARFDDGLSLRSLLKFQTDHVLPAEVTDWFVGSCRKFCSLMRAGGAEPAAKLWNSNIWNRCDVVRIFPESANTKLCA